jgi:hypothetical protein
MTQKGFIPILIVLLVTVVAAISGYFMYTNYSNNQIAYTQPAKVTQSPTPSQDQTANWKIYTNKKYNYSLKHPEEIEVFKAFENGDVVFSKKGEQQSAGYPVTGMQILFRGEKGTNPETAGELGEINCTPEAAKIQTACNPIKKPVQINNAVGVQVTSNPGYDYYLTDIDKKHPVVRIIISSDVANTDLSIFQTILSTFKFTQ